MHISQGVCNGTIESMIELKIREEEEEEEGEDHHHGYQDLNQVMRLASISKLYSRNLSV